MPIWSKLDSGRESIICVTLFEVRPAVSLNESTQSRIRRTTDIICDIDIILLWLSNIITNLFFTEP